MSSCIERTAGDITIHDSYANVVETDVSGIQCRGSVAASGRDWGVVGMARNLWRRVIQHRTAALRAKRTGTRYPKDVVRESAVLARRGAT